ncbi:MAG: phosphotransferase [Blastochloris sp.]|nr:phosphotransferase [Blastochloris sp.]
MFLHDQEIRNETVKHLGLTVGQSLHLEPILKGGSDRRFLRAIWDKGSCIVMEYGLERAENALYTEIARFLESLDLDVPRVLHTDSERHLVWSEDLGTEDLWSYRKRPWEERAPLYRSVLDQINRLHDKGLVRAERQELKLMPSFDLGMYEWERNYFYEKFIQGACGLAFSGQEKEVIETSLRPFATALVQEKPSLVHRDFQSQNIMVRGSWTYLIDFQGMRSGVLYYDLASLLYDPYVVLNEAERQELLDFYYVLPGWRPEREFFNGLFAFAAVQRLMQALGAYGFLGLEKGKPAFLLHVNPALAHLRWVVSQLPHMEAMQRLLEKAELHFSQRHGV